MTARCRGVPIDKEDWAGCHANNPQGTICPVCNNGTVDPVDGVMALAAKESVALAWAYEVPYERSARIAAARVDAIKDMLHGKVLNLPWTAFDGFRRDDLSSAMGEEGVSTEDLVTACIRTITEHVDVKEAAIVSVLQLGDTNYCMVLADLGEPIREKDMETLKEAVRALKRSLHQDRTDPGVRREGPCHRDVHAPALPLPWVGEEAERPVPQHAEQRDQG